MPGLLSNHPPFSSYEARASGNPELLRLLLDSAGTWPKRCRQLQAILYHTWLYFPSSIMLVVIRPDMRDMKSAWQVLFQESCVTVSISATYYDGESGSI